jgi:hypothetical protein
MGHGTNNYNYKVSTLVCNSFNKQILQISMSVRCYITTIVAAMQPVITLWPHSSVLVILGTQETEHFVKVR